MYVNMSHAAELPSIMYELHSSGIPSINFEVGVHHTSDLTMLVFTTYEMEDDKIYES